MLLFFFKRARSCSFSKLFGFIIARNNTHMLLHRGNRSARDDAPSRDPGHTKALLARARRRSVRLCKKKCRQFIATRGPRKARAE